MLRRVTLCPPWAAKFPICACAQGIRARSTGHGVCGQHGVPRLQEVVWRDPDDGCSQRQSWLCPKIDFSVPKVKMYSFSLEHNREMATWVLLLIPARHTSLGGTPGESLLLSDKEEWERVFSPFSNQPSLPSTIWVHYPVMKTNSL